MTQYRIREKQFSIGDDFWVKKTVDGERAFKIDGKGFVLPWNIPAGERHRR